MTPKSFIVLAVATAVSVVAATGATFTDRDAPVLAAAGERLFPDLADRASDIAEISVKYGDMEMTISRSESGFIDNASGYPVDTAKLRELVTAMTMAEIVEAKTTDPARHADLGLAAPGSKEGAGIHVTFGDAEGNAIASVISGKSDYTLGGVAGGQYLRHGDEDATWLVRGQIDPPTGRADWFDTQLFKTDAADIASVSLIPAKGEPISLIEKQDKLKLETALPEGRVANEASIGRISSLFSSLEFSDVRAADKSAKTGAKLTAKIKDGGTVTVSALVAAEDADKIWVRITADGDGKAVRALTDRVKGFDFVLQDSNAELLGWSLDDLTKETAS